MRIKCAVLAFALLGAFAGQARSQSTLKVTSATGTLATGIVITGSTYLDAKDTTPTLSCVITDPRGNVVVVGKMWTAPTPGSSTNFTFTTGFPLKMAGSYQYSIKYVYSSGSAGQGGFIDVQ